METDLDAIKNEILIKNLSIQNVLKKIQDPGTTEMNILLLNSEYRTEFKHLKQLTERYESLLKEECKEIEYKEDVDLYKSQLISLQTYFRCLPYLICTCHRTQLFKFC